MNRKRTTENPAFKNQRIITAVLLIILAAAVIVCVYTDLKSTENSAVVQDGNYFLVHFIDVGQGDAALVESPDGDFMLIDSGPQEGSEYLVKYLMDAGVESLEYFIISHPHSDHYGGASDVIKNFPIENFIIHKDFAEDYPYDKFIRWLKNNKFDCDTKIIKTEINDSFEFADCAEFAMISPVKIDRDDINESSLCFKLVYQNTAFMFVGDAERESERRMLSASYNLNADVLKVGHHGSSSSNTKAFINAVSPEYAVVSCAKNNDYGHPHREVVALFREKDIPLLITSELSDIVIVSDGDKVWLSE